MTWYRRLERTNACKRDPTTESSTFSHVMRFGNAEIIKSSMPIFIWNDASKWHANKTLLFVVKCRARDRERGREIHDVVNTYCFFCSVLVSLQFKAVLFVSAPFIVASTHASRFSPYTDFEIGISKLLAGTRLASSFFSCSLSPFLIRFGIHRTDSMKP